MIGRTVSHYRITKQLGAGGMGVVYEAVDLNLDRTVALKFLPPGVTHAPEAKERFIQEAKAASALDHPNVCNIHEIDEADDGQLFIVMACYEGETLKDRLARGPLPLDEAVSMAQDIARGLAKAHELEIVHRDIKPANIFITSEGMVKILDFGLAKLSNATLVTKVGSTLGTVAYMSPEQAQGGATDNRTDLWSLGSILYEMVTGRPPFPGDHEPAVIYSILHGQPEPATGLRTGVPMALERLLDRCLEKEPAERYQTAEDLVSDLGRVQRQFAPESRSTMIIPPEIPLRRRWPLAVVGGGIAVVLVVLGLFWGLNIGNVRGLLSGGDDHAPIRSLAVLPFNNLMADAEQDYFVDGLHESLLTELSKIGSLRIISRTSAMYYRDTDKSIPVIARELDVDALVEGSVLRVDNRVRINAQLIRGANDEHLWAEDYDRDLQDILNLLSEVARTIAGEIQVVLTPQQQELLTTERMVDPDVYEAYLRGIHHLHKFTVRDALEARRYFEQVIAADPNFAPAYAGLGGIYVVSCVLGGEPVQDLFASAREASRRALELDPGLGVAHTILGFVELYFNWDWAAAEQEFRQALALDPTDGDALHGLASVQIIYGQYDESVDLVLRASKYDPYSYLRNVAVWVSLMFARKHEQVITEVEQWRAFSGDTRAGWYFLFDAYSGLGRDEEAMVELRHSTTGSDPEAAAVMETAYAEQGIPGACLVCAEYLADLSRRESLGPLTIAAYFARAGDEGQTFAWLEKIFEGGVLTIHFILQPAFDPYREDPRFVDILRRIGFPELDGG